MKIEIDDSILIGTIVEKVLFIISLHPAGEWCRPQPFCIILHTWGGAIAMSKLDKLPVKNEVIHQLAIRESQTSIAEKIGVDESTISRFSVKKMLENSLKKNN